MRFLPVLVACLTLVGAQPAWGRHFDPTGAMPAHRCEHVAMLADDALCSGQSCALLGHARLTCDDLALSGDHIDVSLDANQQFAGARAQGHVVLVDGLRVLTCAAISLDADRIKGRIDAATLALRRRDATLTYDAQGVPQGRNAFVVHGTLIRESQQTLQLRAADFTLCDCGPDRLPSWRFDAPHIELRLGERATIWWPRLRVGLANRWLVSITPPLLPLSLPLTERAAGFLPPQIAFLRLPWPTVDLPFFIPLGPSWDITVIPGVRTDWAAPRLGARLRYHPSNSTTGGLRLSYTHDGRQGMAHSLFDQAVAADPTLRQSPPFLALDAQRRQLTERLSIAMQHQTRLTPSRGHLDALVDAAWVSDDQYNRDFLIDPEQRVAAYLPSRGAVLWYHPSGYASLEADAMLRLDSLATLLRQPNTLSSISNVRGAQTTTLHRAPAVAIGLLPRSLGRGFYLEAGANAVRYGNWTGAAPTGVTDIAQNIYGAQVSLGYHNALGPLTLSARTAVDSLWVQPAGTPAFFDLAPLTAADVALPLVRRFGPVVHVIRPQVAYRGVNRHYSPTGPLAKAADDALDIRLVRRTTQQALLSLQQELWAIAPGLQATGTPVLRLDLGQPVDLLSGAVLQPFAELHMDTVVGGRGFVRLSLDPRRWKTEPMREFIASLDQALGPLHLTVAYSRMAPDADRFQRSIYELAAPRGTLEPQTAGDWAHLLRGSLAVHATVSLNVSLSTVYQLPQPDRPAGTPNMECVGSDGRSGATHCFVSHSFGLSYTSPCDCWGIESVLSGAAQDLRNTLRFQILLSIAGTRLGAQPSVGL